MMREESGGGDGDAGDAGGTGAVCVLHRSSV